MIGHRTKQSSIYGPGLRYVIWTQGCTLACEGCWNKQFWPTGGESVTVDELFEDIRTTKGIEGITILGGEPLQQEATLALIERVKNFGLTVFFCILVTHQWNLMMMRKSLIIVTLSLPEDTTNRFETSIYAGEALQIGHTLPTGRYSIYTLDEQNELEIVVNDDGRINYMAIPIEIRDWVESQTFV